MTADNPSQQHRLDELAPLIRQWFDYTEQVVAARRQNGLSAAQQFIALGKGSALRERVGALLDAMRDEEYLLLEQRQARSAATSSKTFLLLPLGVFLTLTMLSLGLFVLNAGVAERTQADDARKETEERLRRSRAQLNAFIEHAPFSIAMLDRDMNYLATSGRWLEEFGGGRADLTGRNYYEVLPEVPAEWRRIHQQGLAGATLKNDDDAWTRANGNKQWLRWAVLPWTDENGTVGGIIISTEDITERKRAEEELRESESRFRQLAESIKEVFWLTDPAKNEMLYVSPAYDEIWGRQRQDLYASPRDWIAAIHPEDRLRVVEAAQTKQARGDYAEEYRVVRPDGSVRWISDRAFPIRGPDGRVFRIAGVAEDITEQRHAREALRESERRFADMLDNVELVSLMLDREARVTYCNECLLRLTGWRREEVLGKNWFDLFVPTDEDRRRDVNAALLADVPIAKHHTNAILTRSGERRLIQWNNSVLRSPTGEVIGTASIGEDITEPTRAAGIQGSVGVDCRILG